MGVFNSRTRPRVNRLTEPAGGVMHSASLVASGSVCSSGRAVHNRAAACVAAGGGIFRKPALSTDKFKLKVISRS